MRKVLSVLALAAVAACSSSSPSSPSSGGSGGPGGGTASGLTAAAFAGSWAGSWSNTTFGSTGPARAVFTVDSAARRFSFTLDLDGSVFGAVDPPAETFAGSYDDARFTVSGPSSLFGTFSLTVGRDGTVTGSATPARGPMTLSGTTTATQMTINYAIRNPPGADITGVFRLAKQ